MMLWKAINRIKILIWINKKLVKINQKIMEKLKNKIPKKAQIKAK